MDKGQKEVTYINRLKVVLAEKHLTNKWLADKLGKGQAPFRMVYQYNAYKYVKEFGEGMGRTRMGGEVHGILNTFQSDRIKANKNDHPFLIDYQNTNDPVLFWFDPNLGLGKIKNADLTIREESNRDFCIFTLGQLALESFGKNYKRKLRPIKQSNDEEVCV